MFEKLLERYDITETAAEQRELDIKLRLQRLSRLPDTLLQPQMTSLLPLQMVQRP